MKKVLVLALVLGVASLATAGLTLSINGGGNTATVGVGETVTVQVIQDVPNATGSGGEMTLNFAGADEAATDTTPNWYFVPPMTSVDGWDWFFNGGAIAYDDQIWFSKTGNFDSDLGANGTPGIGSSSGFGVADWYVSTIEFSFTATETTDIVWGGTWDGVDMTDVVGGTVTVPEPATMALLGLGALVLRRKK